MAPERSTVLAPSDPLAKVQIERLTELTLANGVAVSVLFYWRASVDPAIISRAADWVSPGVIPKKARQEMAEGRVMARVERHAISAPTTMLQAATRWYTGLRLPRTSFELWSGPPLEDRQALRRLNR
jgi:hypothetical protein